jgi:hypothetical protein
MASTFAACVRVSTRRSSVWRVCARCDVLAPLAPDQTRCRECRDSAPARRRRRLAA